MLRRENTWTWRGTTLALTLVAVALNSASPSAEAAQCPDGLLFPAVESSSSDPQSGLTGDYIKPIMDANGLKKYVTTVPNALAPSFIYTPSGTQGGETWYQVSVRQITQSLGLIYNNPKNAADPNNGCTAAPATLWAYGDARDNGVGSAPTAPHSVPGPTFEITSNTPHRVTWTNELPPTHPVNVDPTLDCGPSAPGCAPFNRVVPHVHGAHVADNSDGNPDAWFSANFAVTGHNWTPNTQFGPTGTYRYDNSQEAGTIWYHDHAMGLTHLNVYAGLAGFNIIRDANELNLQATNVLPKYPFEVPMAIQDRVFDLKGQLYTPDQPIRDFNATLSGVPCDSSPGATAPYACTGTNATLPPSTPCDPSAAVGGTYACPKQWFTRNPNGSFNLVAAGTAGAVTFPSITPEFWGNVILVNGQAWPKLDVEKRVYRFRWLNGSDSRTYILRFMLKNTVSGAITAPPANYGLDLWQIGTDQGFLPKPVKSMVNDPTDAKGVAGVTLTGGIAIMPGERVDILADFTNVPAGSAVVLQNIGPDAPYTGEYPPTTGSSGNGQSPSEIAPEVMLFNVIGTMSPAPPTTAPGAITTLRPAPVVPLTPTPGTPVRKWYLAERTDQFGRLALTVNGYDYMAMPDQFVRLNDTEEWEVYNLTPDGHPMHPHLVAFQVINREDLYKYGTTTPFAPPDVPLPLNSAVPANLYSLSGKITPPAPNETAWKDTIFMPPGKVTRIIAKYDIPGLYVFHCHILSHEENDMMRPLPVVTPATSVTLTAGQAGSLTSGPAEKVTFTAAAKTGISAYPDSNAYEYRFSVTPPAGVTTTQPDNMVYSDATMTGVKSMYAGQGYSLVREATWTPPKVPGTYVVQVSAKPMGADPATPGAVVTATLDYTVADPIASGDLNGDGKVDIADALKALQASVGMVTLTTQERSRGDVAPLVAAKPRPDGIIDIGDALVIMKKVLGLATF